MFEIDYGFRNNDIIVSYNCILVTRNIHRTKKYREILIARRIADVKPRIVLCQTIPIHPLQLPSRSQSVVVVNSVSKA